MGVNLRDVKVLIIEDDEQHYNSLKEALGQLGINKIYPEQFKEITEDHNVNDLYDFYLDVILKEEIDIVFFDLALKAGEDATDGTGAILIKMFLQNDDDKIRFITKIILTGAINTCKLDALVEQDVKIVIQKNGNNFKKLLVDYKLNKTIPEFTKLYRELKEHVQYKKELEDIKNKVTSIETITKMIASSLPKLTDKKTAKKLLEKWEKNNNFKIAMGEEFPNTVDNLFLSIKNKIEGLKDNVTTNITEAILEQVKSYIDEESEITGDDTKMVKFFKYSTYVAEEIGRLIHK